MSTFLAIWSLISIDCYGQAQNAINLVPNPGFEEYSSCPDNMTQIYLAVPWTQPLSQSTSDYFHSCSDYNQVISECQRPKTGNGMAGIHADKYANMGEYKEYIQVKLNEELTTGYKYCVSFYVSLMGYSSYGFEEMGMVFTNEKINYYSTLTLPFTPQIINTSGPLLDTTNWMLISGEYIAQGGEEWITVGCFTPGSQMNWVNNYGNHYNYYAYYCLDDFSVFECNEPIQADAGNDVIICSDSSIQLGSGEWDDFTYQWKSSNGEEYSSGMPIVNPQVSTTYYLTQTDRWGGVSYDTVEVRVHDCQELYIPNSFTPNKDNLNECLKISNPKNLDYRINIWNRWGLLVFEGDQSSCWDGTHKNHDVPEGIYIYYIKPVGGHSLDKEYKGFVNVMR